MYDSAHHCQPWQSINLFLYKVDSVTGAAIPGAVFELADYHGNSVRGETDSRGLVAFSLYRETHYALREVQAPAGYQLIDHIYHIFAYAPDCVYVDSIPGNRIRIPNTPTTGPVTGAFTAVKVSTESNLPLEGAVYSLYQNGALYSSATSNAAGQLSFSGLTVGTYTLEETTPPNGFQRTGGSVPVVVAADGSVTIDGAPADGYLLRDVPLDTLAFLKTDASANPLQGAVFALSQNGIQLGTNTSDENGLVNFGLLTPATYQLVETQAPLGYQPNETVYTVVISANGGITVEGTPLEDFVVINEEAGPDTSAPPTIDPITEGQQEVTGTGIPGAEVTVTFPDGSTVTTTVNALGTWVVPVFSTLVAGQVVYAYQTEPGKLPSDVTEQIVLSRT